MLPASLYYGKNRKTLLQILEPLHAGRADSAFCRGGSLHLEVLKPREKNVY